MLPFPRRAERSAHRRAGAVVLALLSSGSLSCSAVSIELLANEPPVLDAGAETGPGTATDTDADASGPCTGARTPSPGCDCESGDTDRDADGTPDCRDMCADDPAKTAPLTCGCGVAENDRDADDTPDCRDMCPDDPLKIGPASCGCGKVETAACSTPVWPSWVAIPSGTFQMGSTAAANEQPVHTVTVAAFELTRSEISVGQYMACVTAGACTEPATWSSNCYWNVREHDDYPVNCVDWNAARSYCTWAGGRLPSEAEWEYAARSAGQNVTYPWGNAPATCAQAIMNEGGDGCGSGITARVCANAGGSTQQGLCDMAGNVFEWVQDSWHGTYDGAPNDGSAWDDGSLRPVRGGSFVSNQNQLRTTARGVYFGATYQNLFIGIRCARNAP